MKNISGQKFGRLTAIARSAQRSNYWICHCDCGKIIEVAMWNLEKRQQSCGCRLRGLLAGRISGIRHKGISAEYIAWTNMRQRCNNPANRQYRNYGGRGIKICPQWNDFNVFLSDVGFRPDPSLTLDRYPDNNGNYEPGNVRWASWSQQALNTRRQPSPPNTNRLNGTRQERKHELNRLRQNRYRTKRRERRNSLNITS